MVFVFFSFHCLSIHFLLFSAVFCFYSNLFFFRFFLTFLSLTTFFHRLFPYLNTFSSLTFFPESYAFVPFTSLIFPSIIALIFFYLLYLFYILRLIFIFHLFHLLLYFYYLSFLFIVIIFIFLLIFIIFIIFYFWSFIISFFIFSFIIALIIHYQNTPSTLHTTSTLSNTLPSRLISGYYFQCGCFYFTFSPRPLLFTSRTIMCLYPTLLLFISLSIRVCLPALYTYIFQTLLSRVSSVALGFYVNVLT